MVAQSHPGGSPDESDDPPIDPPADDPGPELTAMHKQAAGRLHESLKELSPSQRAAVMLSVQEDLTSREIAAVLKCSEATARVHLQRGVARLMRTMKRE